MTPIKGRASNCFAAVYRPGSALDWILAASLLLLHCAGKNTPGRSGNETQNTETENAEAQVETQSASEPVTITGMNIAEKCLRDCLSKQFTAVAVLSNKQKVPLTAKNYRNLGATDRPEWQFSGSAAQCDSAGELAFAPTCTLPTGSHEKLQVRVSIKTIQFPNGLQSPQVASQFSSGAAGMGGKPIYLVVINGSNNGGDLGYTTTGLTGPNGADYTCETTLRGPTSTSLSLNTRWFAAVSVSATPLGGRIITSAGGPMVNPVSSESATTVTFNRPVYTLRGYSSTSIETVPLVPANVDLKSGLQQSAERPSGLSDGGGSMVFSQFNAANVWFMQGCSGWTSSDNQNTGFALDMSTVSGWQVSNGPIPCNTSRQLLCLGVEP